MLRSIDILIGLSVVMLMVSLVVTVFTQAITNLMQTRGRNLLDGIDGLLRQIHNDLPPGVSRKIAEAILTHPLIRSAGSRYGAVIHREELTALILELAAGEAPGQVEASVRTGLCDLLKKNGIDDPAKILASVRAATLVLEQEHPELANDERYAMAFLQEAKSGFLAKVNGWFDQTIDRVSDRFTNSARRITFVGSLLIALFLQLDTVTLVNRLSTDPALRQALVEQAIKVNNPPPVSSGDHIPSLTPQDRENLQSLSSVDVIEIPKTLHEWAERWQGGTWELKFLGILLTAMLLSLGAPFWYNALKNLIRLRSMIAQKDDDQRLTRQTNTASAGGDGAAAAPVT